MSKQLILLRHAKTETYSSSGADFDRELTERGLSDIATVGEQIQPLVAGLQHVYCSTAARARQTYEGMARYLPATADVTYTDAIYLASQGDLLALLNDIPDSINSAMLVGHNPGFHELTQSLSGGALATFPTTTAAVLYSEAEQWQQIAVNNMELVELLTP